MRTVGLIGGMSWESSAVYYRLLNEGVRERMGGLHSARCVLLSVDFAEIEELQRTDRWDEAGRMLASSARSLERAGADLIVLCTNTMHKVAAAISAAVEVPFLHIADVTATAVRAGGVDRVGLLGTRFTMEQRFLAERLEQHGVDVVVPDRDDRAMVHRVIYDELCHGVVNPDSRAAYLQIIQGLLGRGAGGVVLGCTEIGLLVTQQDLPGVPVFDTTRLHVTGALDLALAD